MAQLVWRTSIDLSDNDSGRVTNGLLNADGSCAAVMRRNVYIEPCNVQTWTGVDGDSA